MSDQLIVKDVAIIGAGPSGLFSVFECGMLGLSAVVFDALPEIGGQCTALYPEKPIYDVPGCPAVLAGDLIHNLEKQAAPFVPKYCLNQKVVAISKESGFWNIKTSKGFAAKVSAIVIAAGGGAFGPNRPPLEEIEKYEGTGVQYMVRRKDDFKGKNIVIAGGGDSAVDWALSLAPIANALYVVHRRDKFRASPESVRQMEALAVAKKLELVVPYQLKSLIGTSENSQMSLKGVIVASEAHGDRVLDADVLLPFYGLASELGPLSDWGLGIDHNHIAVDPYTCQTNIDGIYAIGDIAAYKNKLKLILTGFNEAALSAHAIRKQIHPNKEFHFEYSTTKGLPSAA
jgi:thioredoxin reductase (NADPH)